MAIARGQITLVDLTDVSYQGFLTSNKSKMQTISTSGTYSPSWDGTTNKVVITSELYQIGQTENVVGTSIVSGIKWYQTIGTGARTQITAANASPNFVLVGTAGKETSLEIVKNVMTTTHKNFRVECEITYRHPSMDASQVYKLDIDYALAVQGATGATGSAGADGADGSSGITTVLTKENVNIACNQSGTPTTGWEDLTLSLVKVYQGSTALTAVASAPAAKQFAISVGTGVGCTGAKVGNDGFKLATVSAETGSLPITISISDEKGRAQTFTKTFTFVKARAGENARVLTVSSTGTTFTLNESKSAVIGGPSSYVLTANSQNLGGSYSWHYKIDGGTEVAWAGAETTKTVQWNTTQFPSSAKAVTFRLSRDGLNDYITLVAVNDGFSPVLLDLSTPLGYIFRNGGTGVNGTDHLECLATLYKNGAEVTATSYKWYFQGLDGWELITTDHVTDGFIAKATGDTTGANSINKKSLLVLPKAVLNVESFKVEAVYGGTTYTATVSLTDLTDPYTVDLVATKGTTFKNGTGSTDIVANTYHQGSTVSASTLNHLWRVYNKAGNAVTVAGVSDKTENTVTVNASSLGADKMATVACEVSLKIPGTGMSLHYKLETLKAIAEEQGVEPSELPEANTRVFKWSLKELLK